MYKTIKIFGRMKTLCAIIDFSRRMYTYHTYAICVTAFHNNDNFKHFNRVGIWNTSDIIILININSTRTNKSFIHHFCGCQRLLNINNIL